MAEAVGTLNPEGCVEPLKTSLVTITRYGQGVIPLVLIAADVS